MFWNANQLNGSSISTLAPIANQLLKWNGTAWAPADETAYAAGAGLTLNAGTFINTGDLSSTNELQDLSYIPGTSTLNITSGIVNINPIAQMLIAGPQNKEEE